MRPAVFAALLRKAPKLSGEVKFGPSHAADFAEALPGEDQHLQNRPERSPERLGLCPQGSKLDVVKHAIAANFSGRRPDLVDRRRLDEVSFDGPSEESLAVRPDAVRKDRSGTVEHVVEELVNVSDRNFREPPPLPRDKNFLPNQALGRARRRAWRGLRRLRRAGRA